jgi:hypothetical protein
MSRFTDRRYPASVIGACFGALATVAIASAQVLISGPPQKVEYTTTHFHNAPEAVDRILAIDRASNGDVILFVSVAACVQLKNLGPESALRLDVAKGSAADLRPGNYVVTGALWHGKEATPVIRRLTPAEAKACAMRDAAGFVAAEGGS